MEWTTDTAVGSWWPESLRPFHDHCVGSIVPAGFRTVTRVFHPLHSGDTSDFTWKSVAEANGRIAHPDMQLHAIATPRGQRIDPQNAHGWHRWDGDLPRAEMRSVAEILIDLYGADRPIHFGVWEGYGGIRVPSTARDAVLRIPQRAHHLLRGTLSDLEQAYAQLGQTPNLWWPDDRTWCVVSEIDFAWTYIAGSETLATALNANGKLETHRVSYEADHTVHGDRINDR